MRRRTDGPHHITTPVYNSGLNQWYAVLNSFTVSVTESSGITWDTKDTNSCNVNTETGSWDAQGVIAHETGHAYGLGHTGVTSALMHTSLTCGCHTLQSNDISGLQAIYPGYYPA